ncbi:ScpA family protein [Caldicellulosiruptoraceae bacterium PP1]
MNFNVKLPNFEGPLDLLIYLIKKEKINIYDIPISTITDQYIEYINQMENINIDSISEFLIMASTLLEIKSKMLLPKKEELEEDPREDLVERILEYQKLKSFINKFKKNYTYNDIYFRNFTLQLEKNNDIKLDINKLFQVYRNIKRDAIVDSQDNQESLKTIIKKEKRSVSQVIKWIWEKILIKGFMDFKNIIVEFTKEEIVLKFLAILELNRQGKILIRQEKLFDNIKIIKR